MSEPPSVRHRRRTVLAAAGAGMTGVLAGCVGSSGSAGDTPDTPTGTASAPIEIDEDASVSFGMPADGATAANGVRVRMDAESFTIEESGPVNDNAGHFHVLVDTDPVAVGETIPSDEQHLHFGDGSTAAVLDLAPGEHDLTLQVGDGQHRALPLTDEVSVTVAEASVSFAAPDDGATVTAPVAVEFAASDNLEILPSGESGQGTGHFHVLVDADPVPVGEVIPSDEQHVHFGDGSTSADLDLEAGTHTLTLQMGDGAHRALPATDSIEVTVE